jgi:hypothetical protein
LQTIGDTPDSTTGTGAILCPGKCNSAWRAGEHRYETTGNDHDIEPREGQPVWCPPCTTAIRAALAEWPALAGWLAAEVESGVSAGMNEYVSGSKNRPVHDHEAASFLIDEYAEWASEWEATIRVERRLAARKTANSTRATIGDATRFLLAHLDWHLSTIPDGRFHDLPPSEVITEFGLDVLRCHRRAQILTGTQDVEPVRIAGVPCRICDHKALEHEVDDAGKQTGYIRCRKCRPTFRMSPDEYHDWTKLTAAGDKARSLATPAKLAEIFGNSVPKQYQAKR